MFAIWWRSILAKLTNRKSRSEKRLRGKSSRLSSYRIWFEPLEDRLAPIAYTWTGGTSTAWTTAANWTDTGGTYPGTNAADTVTFSAATPTYQPYVGQGLTTAITRITIAAGRNTTISGNNTITLSGGITEIGNVATTANIFTNLTLGAAQTWSVSNLNTLAVSGNVANGGNLLTVTGAGNTTISGVLSGAGALTMSGTGTLALSGANAGFSGNTTINSGAINVDNSRLWALALLSKTAARCGMQGSGRRSGRHRL